MGWGRGFIEESDDFWASSLCILGYFIKVKLPHYLQKTLKFHFASQKTFSLQKIDFHILLFTLKMHHRRYENRLF